MTCAVLVTEAEARAFVSACPGAERIVCLTASARTYLTHSSVNIPIVSSSKLARTPTYLRSVALGERVMEAMRIAIGPIVPPDSVAWLVLERRVHNLVTLGCVALACLPGPGPWLLMVEGNWITMRDREATHRLLILRLIGKSQKATGSPFDVAKAMLFRAVRESALFCLGSGRKWVALPSRPRLGLSKSLSQIDSNIYRAEFVLPRREDLSGILHQPTIALARDLLRSRRDRRIPVRIPIYPVRSHGIRKRLSAAFDEVVQATADQRARNALEVGHDIAITEFFDTLMCAKDAVPMLRSLRPRISVQHFSDSVLSAAIIEASRVVEAPAIALNFNSMSDGHPPAAMKVAARIARQRYVGTQWSKVLCYTPDSLRLLKSVAPELAEHAEAVSALAISKPNPAPERRFHILYACNFIEWKNYQPLIFQTSDEMLDGIEQLAHAVADLPDVEIEVRVMRKQELNPEVIKQALPTSPRMQITDITIPFADRIHCSDLVVAYASTTLTEALHARVPVLMLGPVDRYLHYPVGRRLPRSDERSAAYAPIPGMPLAKLISAIKMAHHGAPLTDDEIAPFVWPSTKQTLADALASLLHGGDR